MCKNNIFFRVQPSVDGSVTGIKDGVTCQVETRFTKAQSSFVDKSEKDYFFDYSRYLWENRKTISIDNFPLIDSSRISKIMYYKMKKRVKETDFMSALTDNSFNMFDFIVSEEIYSLLLAFNLPAYNKVQVCITEFSNQKEYFLLGFPEMSLEHVDYAHSVVVDSFSGKQLKFNSNEEYVNRTYKFTRLCNIRLNKEYHQDVLRLQNTGIFFSALLIESLKQHGITGLDYLKQTITY